MKKSGFIDSVRVESPCSEDWDEMTGNDQVRFCSHCSKSVNNISTMTRKEARKLVLASGGKLCIRYVQHPVTKGPLFAPQLVKIAGRAGLAAGILGASIATAQPVYAQGSARQVQSTRSDEAANTISGARLIGTVLDPNGAVVPSAVVSISDKEAGFYRAIVADAEGNYQFTDLPAGIYTLRVEAAGFTAFENTEIKLTEGSLMRTSATLTLPRMDEVVEVRGEATEWGVTVGIVASTVITNALLSAVMDDDLERVQDLVARGSRINVRDKAFDGKSPLHAAVENGNVEIARYLLERGAKANIRDYEKRTPIMLLDEDSKPELLEVLLSFGAKLKLKDKEKNTALHYAAANDLEPEMIRTLISHGVDVNAVNKERKTALMIAAEDGDVEVVKVMLAAGADVNLKDKEGNTAWDLTISDEIEELLVAHGFSPPPEEPETQDTAPQLPPPSGFEQ